MENLLIPNKIIRSNRKSLSLIINNQGELIVRAPISYKDKQIYNFINKKANWIISKRTNINLNTYKPLTFNSNETIDLLENSFLIKTYDGKRVKQLDNTIFVPIVNSKEKFILFLKKVAKEYITHRVAEIANLFNFKYQSVSISSAKTNWGSCSFQNKIHFTYKLIMCPKYVIDYIIIHELTHTIIKNHSKQFWFAVAKNYPNYKLCEKWLKDNKGIVEII